MGLSTDAQKLIEKDKQNEPFSYLDNAASVPMYPEVIETVIKAMHDNYGNPSSPHVLGKKSHEILEKSRETIADAVGALPKEIIFTSGGTESNNLAITGVCEKHERESGPATIVTTSLEHPSVTKTVRGLKRSGWNVEYLEAINGELEVNVFEKLLQERTDIKLVTVMSVQNELGYRLPVDKIVELCEQYASKDSDAATLKPVIHTDAVQAFGKLDTKVNTPYVDLMSFCGHKIGGPKGIGALYVKEGTEMFTTAFGGGQEQGIRSGTESLPLIAGFAEAVRIACAAQKTSYENAVKLRDTLVTEIRRLYEGVMINSREDGSPFIVNFTLPKTINRKVIEYLSDAGVFISPTMACSTSPATVPPGTWREKHPLPLQLAGIPLRHTKSTYRISFCDRTTYGDVKKFIKLFKEVVPSTK